MCCRYLAHLGMLEPKLLRQKLAASVQVWKIETRLTNIDPIRQSQNGHLCKVKAKPECQASIGLEIQGRQRDAGTSGYLLWAK